MSTHNVCCHEEIRKIVCGYALLSEAMCKTKDALNSLSLLQKQYSQWVHNIQTALIELDSTSDIK